MANVTSGHKRKALLPTTVLLGLVFYSLSAIAQIRVIDNKGTIQMVDTSKWKLTGTDIGNKNTGNVGIGTYTPMAKFHNTGATILGSVVLTNIAANGDIGTAAATVDTYSGAVITQTTAGITLTLPNPTNNPAGRVFQVSNAAASAQAVTVQGVTIAPGSSALYRWDGAAWNTTTALANNIPLSGLTAAVNTNSINNGDFAQTWNWNTSTANNPLTIATSSLTTGNLFSLTNTNAAQTGKVLSVSSNATAPAGGIANFSFSGTHTGNAINITDVTNAGNAVAITTSTLTTGAALNIAGPTATGLTIGNLIKATGFADAGTTGTGLLNITNTNTAATGGVVATIKSNSATVTAGTGAGSALTVYANGNVGVNTTTATGTTGAPDFTSSTAQGATLPAKPTFGVDGTINANNYTSPVVSLTDGATITWDLSQGNNAKVTLGGAGRTLNLVNLKAGMYGTLIVTQGVASSTITTIKNNGAAIVSKVINGGGGVLSFTTTVNAVDTHCFFYDGTNLYWTSGFNYN